MDDVDYDAFSMRGQDIIEYRIPLNNNGGIADLDVSLLYHTFPARWMQDLFEHDGITEVSQFKAMYDGYEMFVELIDSIVINDLILEPSGVSDIKKDGLYIFPNPVRDRKIHIGLNSSELAYSNFEYRLVDIRGLVLMSGELESEIALDMKVVTGLYFLQIIEDTQVVFINPLVVL